MTQPTTTADLFDYGQACLADFIREFETYDLFAEPGIKLRKGTGMLCYYDFKDRNIYLSLPDQADPAGKLHLLFLRSVLGCESNEDLMRFLKLFIPQILAHELAHHFRHRYGLFTTNLWEEEQIANQLALAVTKHRLTPEDREYARRALRRAIDGLTAKMEAKNSGTDSYYNILYGLNASGQIKDDVLEDIDIVQKIFAIDPEKLLRSSGRISEDLLQRLELRDDIIDDINHEYASDYMKYICYQVEWLYLSLNSREAYYVDEFARVHLNRRVSLLPIVVVKEKEPPEAIKACFKAYQDTMPLSTTGGLFFYKRYRALLLRLLQSVEMPVPSQTRSLRKETDLLLESWDGIDSDTLNYLAELAPPEHRPLFPQEIADHIDPALAMQVHLPTDTDKRLWKYIALRESDASAANTLARLDLLEQVDMYRPLPAEALLQLAHNLCRIKLAEGETIIWEGQINDDVFILIEGEVAVFVTQQGRLKQVGKVCIGEVFGEISFFTHLPRNATVRATMPSECFVLKHTDLKLFAFDHPSILMQMAGALARRLDNLNKH